MTLITYLTKVHFADGILEEALWSEIKALKKKHPLVIAESSFLKSDISERFFAGLPIRIQPELYCDIPNVPTEQSANEIANLYLSKKCDVLIAFGSSRAIDLAKISRVAIKHPNTGLVTFSYTRGGSKLIGQNLPDLIVVPSISGVSSSVSAHSPVVLKSGDRVLLMCKKLIPVVTVCDPTVTLGVGKEETASAGADAITNCIEAFVSNSYNPPAEGIAYDGLSRAIANLGCVIENPDNIDSRREMMAASLNGALALQKGLGASKAISSALEAVSNKMLDRGTLNRITLPSVLRYNEQSVDDKYDVLRKLFISQRQVSFPEVVEDYFNKLPLAKNLSELGFEKSELVEAAAIASNELSSITNPRTLNSNDYHSIMKSVY